MAHRGERLDQYLSVAFPHLSRSRIKGLIDEGMVRLGSKVPKAGYRLRGNEEVSVTVPPPAPMEAQPEALPLRLLYQDRDIVVLDKAAGMVVHPAAGNWKGTVVNALLYQVKDLAGIGGSLRPGLVHRLDKETSGCLVVAKHDEALTRLQQSFKAHQVNKVYWALVHGVPPAQGTFRTLHGRHPIHRKRFTGKVREGKPAVTHYRVLEAFEQAAWVEINLETGRTHQIRVHFSEAGFPLLADSLYKSRKARGSTVAQAESDIGRTALHARRLEFPHPRSSVPVAFEAELPDDFVRALIRLRGSSPESGLG